MKYKIYKKTIKSKIDRSIIKEEYYVKYKINLFWKWARYKTTCSPSLAACSYKRQFESYASAERYVTVELYPSIVKYTIKTKTTCLIKKELKEE